MKRRILAWVMTFMIAFGTMPTNIWQASAATDGSSILDSGIMTTAGGPGGGGNSGGGNSGGGSSSGSTTVPDYFSHLDIAVDGSFDYNLTYDLYNSGGDLNITKVWYGVAEEDQPDSISVKLCQNGTEYGDPIEITKADGWKKTVEVPLLDEDDNEIIYDVKEEGISFGNSDNIYSYIVGDIDFGDIVKSDGTSSYVSGSNKIVFYHDDNAPKMIITTANGTTTVSGSSWVYDSTKKVYTYSDEFTVEDEYTYTWVWTYDPSTQAYSYYSPGLMQVTSLQSVTYVNNSNEVVSLPASYYEEGEDGNRDDEYTQEFAIDTNANTYRRLTDFYENSEVEISYNYKYYYVNEFGVQVTETPAEARTQKITATHENNVCEGDYTQDVTMYGFDAVLDFELDEEKDSETLYSCDVTVANSILYDEISVEKSWDDNDNNKSTRPESVTVNLYGTYNKTEEGSDEPTTYYVYKDSTGTVSITTEEKIFDTISITGNSWAGKFENLPVYAPDGSEINYSVEEVSVPGYTSVITGSVENGFKITNTLETVDVGVSKIWDDADNQDGKRPSSLTVTLSNGQSVELNESNNWSATIEDLPKYNADGQKITYTWTEGTLPEGYSLTNTSTTPAEDGTVITTLTNSYTPEVTSATVRKVWDDNEDQDGVRPESLTVTLSNGTEVTLNEANGWSATVENLPKYSEGEEILYTWAEGLMPEGYSLTNTDIEGTITTLTNTYPSETTSVAVKKVWDDASDQDGLRPESLTVTLSNGQTVTLNEGNGWYAEITGLPKYANGQEIAYTWTEGTLPEGYKLTDTSVAASEDGTVVITTLKNSHTPEITEISGSKIWDDNNDQDGIRPESVVINLYGTYEVENEDGTGTTYYVSDDLSVSTTKTLYTSQEVTGSTGNEWTYSFESLPKYVNGHEITWSVTEDAVLGYTTSIDGYNVTNTLETVEVNGTKIWDDNNNANGNRSSKITVTLTGTIEGETEPVVTESVEVKPNADGTWTYSFTNLPEYMKGEDGSYKKVVYSVSEEKVDGYKNPVITGDAESGFVITNTENKISISGEKIWDDNNDSYKKRPTSVVINLLENGTIAQSKTVSAGEDGIWKYEFTDLPEYKNGKKVEYTITENAVDGYKTTYSETNVTNTYIVPVYAEITGTKTLTGPKALAADAFTFVLVSADGQQELQTVTNNADGTFSFGQIEYTEPGTYTYLVKESIPASTTNNKLAGTTYDATIYTVTVTVTEKADGSGQLNTPVVSYGEGNTLAAFTNAYEANGELAISGTKTLSGKALANEQFEFGLYDSEGKLVGTAKNNAEGAFTFGTINFTAPGTYNYTVKELIPQTVDETYKLNGITYDATVYDVIVTVTDNGNGTLTPTYTVKIGDKSAAGIAFANKYEATGSVEFDANKTLEGKTLEAGKYTFQLKDKAGNVLQTKTNAADGSIKFDAINYTQDDIGQTYEYTISEVKGSLGGITYDETIHKVSVTITDNGDGTLSVTPSTSAANITFTNKYTTTPTKAKITGSKTLTGRDLNAGEFSFELKDSDGNVLQTKTNAADGTVVFDEIEYTAPGTYTYTVSEVKGELGGVTYDGIAKTVVVDVVDNGDGTLTATVVGGNSAFTFSNAYNPASTTATISGTKALTGRALAAGEFTFQLTGEGQNLTTTNLADGTFTFAPIKYTEVGTYTYTVSEVAGSLGGVTYDENKYTVTVTVTDNQKGQLVASVSYGDSGSITFSNEYDADPVKVSLNGTKTLTKNAAHNFTWKAGTFVFKVSPAVDNDKELDPIKEAYTVTNGDVSDGSAVVKFFENVRYTAPGEFLYVISEVNNNIPGVTPDGTEYTIKVTVTDPGDGQLVATITDLEGNAIDSDDISFNNTYNPGTASATIHGTKSVEGKPLEDKEFSFQLKDESGNVLETVTNVAGNFTFDGYTFSELKYDKAGTYKYTISEVVADEKGYTYDTTVTNVTVTVTEANGALTAAVTYGSNGSTTPPAYTNTYNPEDTSVVLSGTKALTGRDITEGEFTFVLSDSEGNTIETVNDADGKFSFTAINYDTIDGKQKEDFVYYITEQSTQAENGITYDNSVYRVTVTVTDTNHEGKLAVANVKYEKQTGTDTWEVVDAVAFSNEYEAAPTELALGGYKTLTGRTLADGEFKFQLLDKDGNLIQEVANNGTAFNFDAIEYETTGTYNYTIKEVKENLGGITYDETVYNVEVVVTDPGTGKLVATPSYSNVQIQFTNTYAATGSVTFGGTKQLEGRTLNAGEFTFELKDSAGNVLQTATNAADGTVTFETITYNLSDVGEHTYTITEVDNGLGGVTYDKTTETIKVTVTDNGDGTLKVTADQNKDNVTFSNKYEAAPAEITLGGAKVLTGRDLKSGEFSFKLVKEDGTVVEIIENINGGFTFDALKFDSVGTYKYKISEVKGDRKGVEYDDTVYEVTVTVTDDGKGQLHATANLTASEIVFNNVYTTEVTGAKTWVDSNDKYSNRPDSIAVNLYASYEDNEGTHYITFNDKGEKVISSEKAVYAKTDVTADGNWTYKFDQLPVYADNGALITYKVDEDAVTGYNAKVTGNNITNTAITTNVSGAKTWGDNNDQYGNRPEEITINLYATYEDDGQLYYVTEDNEGNVVVSGDKEIYATETVTADDNWAYGWNDLPAYYDGIEITYVVEEDAVKGYTDSYDGYNVTNTPDVTNINGEKVWDDADNQDGVRPQSVTVSLYAAYEDEGQLYYITEDSDGNVSASTDKAVYDEVIVTEASNWMWGFKDLPKYYENYKIKYTVDEINVPAGYESKVEGTTITNTHTPEKTSISGTKKWVGETDGAVRPDSVTIHLLKNGEIFKTQTVTAEDDWTYTFSDLDKFEDGDYISYSVVEEAVTDYTTTYNGKTIVNTYTPGKTSITVAKSWDDDNDYDGIRPNEITVQLYADGEAVEGKTVVLNGGNNWTASFTELDAENADGETIEYTVAEPVLPDGYTSEVTEKDGNIFVVENTHTPETLVIEGTKTWDDNDDAAGKRPDSVTVILIANGTPVEYQTITAEDNWSWKFENLPSKENGEVIEYAISEKTVEGYYMSSINGTSGITNTYDPDKTNIQVIKSWQDDDDRESQKTESVHVQLLASVTNADGTTTTTIVNNDVELNAGNDWTYNFTGLDKYTADGIEIKYSVKEKDSVDGYITEVTEVLKGVFDVINVHEPELTSISGTKVWRDSDDQDGIRPDSVTINLLKNGTKVDSKVVTSADGWSYSFTNLKKFENGVEVQYTVTEDAVDNYSAAVDGTTITNSYTPGQTSVTVTKAWKDNNDQDGIRPEEIQVQLYADGEPVNGKVATIKGSESHTWTGLPLKANGETITYTVQEVEVPEGYTSTITGSATEGYTITNTHTPETTKLSGTKVWDDANNQDGIRPGSITVNVWNGDTKVDSKTVTAAEDGTWTWEFTGLAKYQNGTLINYTFTEEKVDGYESAVEGSKITNTHVPETITIKGEKIWDDADNQDGKRPSSVIINIMDGGNIVDTVTASAENNWKYESKALPKYRAGEEIEYTVDEVVSEETAKIYDKSIDGYNITNTHIPETIDISGTKVWDDADNQDGKRPESITVNLLADGVEIDEMTIDADDDWSYAFNDLPKFADGEEITYTVTEDSVTDYTTTYDGYNIKNSYTPGKTSVTVNKVWVDGTNQDGIRPVSVTAVLYADGVQKDTAVLSESNGWTYTWTDLDEKKAGQTITYTVGEYEVPDGYEASVEGTTITNTHTPETVNITGTKTWNDNDDQDGIRPESITVNVIANIGSASIVVDTVTVVPDAAGNWSYTSKALPKYANGEEITYTVEEAGVPDGYASVVSGHDIINTHTPETTEISGTKTWNDADDQDGKRPEYIRVNLLADGVEIDEVTIDADDNWAWKFTNLPKFADGEEIVYTITEDKVADYSTDVDGYDIDNCYTPGKTSVSVTKAWEDAGNQDGIRPNSVIVQLYADGEAVEGMTKELNQSNNWSASFTELDEYKEGQLIAYTVAETADITGYETEVSGDAEEGYVITNTHEPETTSVTGTKTWNDDGDQDGKRPESLTVKLLANGAEVDSQDITEEDGWAWSFTDLPKFEAGKLITYTVAETLPDGYSETGEAGSYDITNSHTPDQTSVKITKFWNDGDDQDGIRPKGVVMVLLANGESTGQFALLSADNKWTATITGLDKYEDGVAINYSFEELEIDGYTSAITGDMTNGFTAVNTHTPETVTIDGVKTWNDDDNQDGVRPESIVINLLADGKKIDSRTVTAEDGWTWEFTGLAKYKDQGTAIKYTVVEEQISNYDTTLNNVKHDVTNTHIPSRTTVTVAKKWNDSNDQDGIRPDSITVYLYANGQMTGKSIKLNESNKWVGTFNDLDEYEAGEKIKYTVSEKAIEDYTTVITGKDTKYITITNTHEPEVISVSGSKTWNDANDQDGMRPESITVTLLADGVAVDSATVTEDDNWAWEFENVARFKDGKEITYTVSESTVAGYTASYNGMDITNTHEPETTDISGTKTWDDADDQDGVRPESITVNLLADGNVADFAEVTAADGWTWTFEDLPVYKDGEKIEYTVEEFPVDGYETEVNGFDITNTHEPATTDIEGSKTWDDADDQDGLRPESITVKLMANGKVVDSVTVTAADDWAWKFADLPVYAAGEEIEYAVKEVKVSGYTSEVDGFDITNTHEPQTIDISGAKTWNDEDDQDGARPESITVKLLANGAEADSITVTADDNWAWTFEDLPKYKDGEEINYVITEAKVADYSTEINGYDITNIHTPGKTSITVVKAWDDAGDQDGIRPDSVTVKLLADGEDTGKTAVLSADSKWTAVFSDLDEYDDGELIEYTVEEVDVEGYTAEVSGSADEALVITNTHEPETTDISGSKTWNDNGDEADKRPESIVINLLADGTVVDSERVTAEDDWSWTFEDLPVYKAGEKIEYTVAEEAVAGYNTIVDGYDVINTLKTPAAVGLDGIKVLDGEGAELEAGQFSFRLYDAEGNQLETVSNDEYGYFTFTEFSYDEEGTFVYFIRELIPDEAEEIEPGEFMLDGVIYDTTVYKYTVEVGEGEDGNYTVTSAVLQSADGAAIATAAVTAGLNIEFSTAGTDWAAADTLKFVNNDTNGGTDNPTDNPTDGEEPEPTPPTPDDGDEPGEEPEPTPEPGTPDDDVFSEPEDKDGAAQTGDESNMTIYLIIALLAAATATMTVTFRRKED